MDITYYYLIIFWRRLGGLRLGESNKRRSTKGIYWRWANHLILSPFANKIVGLMRFMMPQVWCFLTRIWSLGFFSFDILHFFDSSGDFYLFVLFILLMNFLFLFWELFLCLSLCDCLPRLGAVLHFASCLRRGYSSMVGLLPPFLPFNYSFLIFIFWGERGE